MNYQRTFNFSAGPAMMPEPVLEEIRDEMLNYRGSGMCVMEMSHRSDVFQQIVDEAEQGGSLNEQESDMIRRVISFDCFLTNLHPLQRGLHLSPAVIK